MQTMFENPLKYILTFILPLFILFNVYAIYVYEGGNDFILGFSFDTWRNSYLGLTGIYAFYGDLIDDEIFNELIQALRKVINVLSFDVNSLIDGFKTGDKWTVLKTLTEFFKWFGNALIQPFRLIASVVKLIVPIFKFIMNAINSLYQLFGGYYNTKFTDNSSNTSAWNYIGEHVYAMVQR